MPIFEYRCEDCAKSFEKLVRSADTVACPQCAGTKLERQYSTFSAKAEGAAPMRQPQGGCGGPACQMGMCGSKN